MNERLPSSGYSRRLPPADAWIHPDQWINPETGNARFDSTKLELPSDDRGFVDIDESIKYVLQTFFWPDYEWSYLQDDPETKLDKHHFQHRAAAYAPQNFGGDKTAWRFRENATRIGVMPRQLHNVFHDLTSEPAMPALDAMQDFNERFELARQIFVQLITSAKNVKEASRNFSLRSEAIKNGLVIPMDPTDQVAQEIMRDFFSRYFKQYGDALDKLFELNDTEFLRLDQDRSVYERPHLVIKKMGQLMTRNHVNVVSYLNVA